MATLGVNFKVRLVDGSEDGKGGLWFDEFLTWEYQVDHISRKLASGNFAINSTKKLLPKKVKMLIYNSLVKSHLEYGIVAWGGANQKLLKKTK